MLSYGSIGTDFWEYRAASSLLISSAITLLLWLALRTDRARALLPPPARFWVWWIVCLRFALAVAPAPTVAVSVPPLAATWLESSESSLFANLTHARSSAAPLSIAPLPAPPAPILKMPAAPLQPAASTIFKDAPALSKSKPSPIHAPRIANEAILLLVWAFGAAVRLASTAIATLKARRLIREARDVECATALQLIKDCWAAPSQPRLLQHPAVASPFAANRSWGNAVILLPDWLLAEEPNLLKTIFAHEIRHLRRRDVWLGFVPWLCRVTLWWLPAATLAAAECARCAEEDCDLAAIRGAAAQDIGTYAHLLIRLALLRPDSATPLGASSLTSHYKSMRLRLLAIKAAAQSAPKTGWLALLIACCLCGATLGAPCFTVSLAKAALLIADAAAAAPASAPVYQLVDLGEPGSSVSAAESIGGSGEIVGYEKRSGQPGLRGFAWRDGRRRLLPANLGFKSTRVVAVNSRGDMALSAFGAMRFQHAAIVAQNGAITPLQAPVPFRYATAVALNDAGAAAGYVYSGKTFGKLHARAAVWKNGQMQALGALGGACSQALGINAQGDVVGKADLSPALTHAFLLPGSSGGRLSDLGALADSADSAAYAVNDNGAIVGYSATTNPLIQHAVLWPGKSTQPVDLGGLVQSGISKARSINDAGEIVGVSTNPGGSGARATLWRRGRVYDLNAQLASQAPGWTLRYAVGVNNAGQIVGVGQKSGQTHGFLLNPLPLAASSK